MPALINRPMPDVKRFSTRSLKIASTENQLDFQLQDWIKEILDYIGQNRGMGASKQLPNGMSPQAYLTLTADGKKELLKAAKFSTGMSTDGKRTVYASFEWKVNTNGSWYIDHVKFAIQQSQAELTGIEKRALKEKLLDKAEAQNAMHFHPRQYAFPAEEYVKSWHAELATGLGIVKSLDATLYGWAAKEASLPKNPFTPWDIAMGLLPGVKGPKPSGALKGYEGAKQAADAAKKAAEDAEKLTGWTRRAHEAKEKFEKAKEGYEKVKKAYERGEAAHKVGEKIQEEREGKEGENRIYNESKGDIIAKLVVDETADVVGELVPGAGGLIKMFAGMICDVAIAGMSGKVAQIRGRIYACAAAGLITSMTLTGGTTPPPNKLDKEYYDKGLELGRMSKLKSFQLQLALLEYTRTHYTDKWWGGVSYQFRGVSEAVWDFPGDYIVKWSPELLGRSLIVQLWRHGIK